MAELLAGIDIGTSGVKAGVFDAGGELLGLGRASHKVETPRPGWAESDPEEWWHGLVKALREACDAAGVAPADIGAVGLSVLFPAVVPLDQTGRALHPAILYCDQRSRAQVAAIEKTITREAYESTVGNRLVPGTCAVTSMAWLRDERREAYAGARTLGFANTFAVARLTGEFVTDPSNASLSGLVAICAPRRWSEEICEKLGLDQAALPRIVGSAEVAGAVTKAAASDTGLRAGTPVVAGSGDAVASAVGAGLASGDSAVYIAGSSDCLTVPMTRPSEERSCVNCAYVPRGVWLGIGTTTSSGASVDWFAREILGGGGAETLDLMTELAASSPPGANGVLFTPYLQGERTPLWDPRARGGFLGITAATTRADLARAVFEGAALSLRQIVESVESFAGTRLQEIRAVGGGTKNPLWNRMKADVLQREFRVMAFQETGTRGAALLAGLGAGVYPSFEEAAAAPGSEEAKAVEPNPERAGAYEELFQLHSQIYSGTREVMHGLAARSGAAGEERTPP
jgi:xylulokinase